MPNPVLFWRSVDPGDHSRQTPGGPSHQMTLHAPAACSATLAPLLLLLPNLIDRGGQLLSSITTSHDPNATDCASSLPPRNLSSLKSSGSNAVWPAPRVCTYPNRATGMMSEHSLPYHIITTPSEPFINSPTPSESLCAILHRYDTP